MRYSSLFVAVMLSACAPVTQTANLNKASGAQAYASVGDIMIHAEAKESLPNAFGQADIFGRTREAGFSELRYMGFNKQKQPIFRRRDVDVVSNASTMTRTPVSVATVNAQSSAGSVTATGTAIGPLRENTQVLPADTVEFALDLSKSRTITIRDHAIEIVEATPAGVTFIPR
jgi:hypothetical protein